LEDNTRQRGTPWSTGRGDAYEVSVGANFRFGHSVLRLLLAGQHLPCPDRRRPVEPGARLEDAVNQQTHIHTGYFSFEQKGSGFSGTGQQSGLCTSTAHGDYTGPLANDAPFAIREGIQSGDHVSFKTDLCTYEGTLSADADHIDGTTAAAIAMAGSISCGRAIGWPTGRVETSPQVTWTTL
jgi:hypothetical protein